MGLRAPPPATFRGEGEPLKRTLCSEGPARPTANRALNGNYFFVLSVCLRGLAPVQTRCSPHPLLASFLEPGCVSREGCQEPGRGPGLMEDGFQLSCPLPVSLLPSRRARPGWGLFLAHLHFGCLFLGVLLPAPWEALLRKAVAGWLGRATFNLCLLLWSDGTLFFYEIK